MSKPLAITGLGMTSCLGQGASECAAAIQCGYNNFQPVEFYVRYDEEKLLGAKIEGSVFTGKEHLIEMAMEAIADVLKDTKLTKNNLPLIVLFPNERETPLSWHEEFQNAFFSILGDLFEDISFNQDSVFIRKSKTGIVHGLAHVQNLIYEKNYEQVMVLCIDTLLNVHRVSLYENYNETPRILSENNPDGFIPGESAVALLLSKPDSSKQTCITGIGLSREKAVVGSSEVLKAEGMTKAIKNAVNDAGCKVIDTQFVISSVSGESYFFKEVAIARSKSLESKLPSHPLWHPADCIGEVGAAVGGAIILMGHYAFINGYSPGNRALCLVSNDDEERGAFILEMVG